MAVPNELPDGRDIGVSNDKVALDIDDIRAGARKNLLPREPRLCVLPKRKRGSGRKQNRQNAMTREKKGDARRQTAGSERQGKDLAPGECDRVRNEEIQRDQDKPQPNCRASYNRAGPSAGIAAYASPMGTFTSEPVSRTGYR